MSPKEPLISHLQNGTLICAYFPRIKGKDPCGCDQDSPSVLLTAWELPGPQGQPEGSLFTPWTPGTQREETHQRALPRCVTAYAGGCGAESGQPQAGFKEKAPLQHLRRGPEERCHGPCSTLKPPSE